MLQKKNVVIVRNADVVVRTVHGSIFLIDISDNYCGDKCALYEINETGKFLWETMDGQVTVETLSKALQSVLIDVVPYEVLYNDVSEYIKDLKSKGFVLEVSENG